MSEWCLRNNCNLLMVYINESTGNGLCRTGVKWEGVKAGGFNEASDVNELAYT